MNLLLQNKKQQSDGYAAAAGGTLEAQEAFRKWAGVTK